jgi:hypothetical protein
MVAEHVLVPRVRIGLEAAGGDGLGGGVREGSYVPQEALEFADGRLLPLVADRRRFHTQGGKVQMNELFLVEWNCLDLRSLCFGRHEAEDRRGQTVAPLIIARSTFRIAHCSPR